MNTVLDVILLLAIFAGYQVQTHRWRIVMDTIAALQASVDAESATLDQIAAAQATTDADLKAATDQLKVLQAELANQADLSPAAKTALAGVQTSVTSAAQKSAAILAALQAGDPNTVPKTP